MKFSFEKSSSETEDQDYEFFDYEIERREVFNYSKRISEYLRTEKIPNLVIIDRSSRPLYIGVKEYFKSKYPNEKPPNIYFMNPKGFKAREELTEREINDVIMDCIWKEDTDESPKQVRSKKDILKEFEDTYKRLMQDKEKPVLVFDTCIHSGDSLRPVKQSMIDLGFSNIRIGAINPAEDSDSKVKTDFFVTRQRPEKGCYPFDRDRIVEKTFDHIYSKMTQDESKREASLQLRKEIKRIMRKYLDKEEEN